MTGLFSCSKASDVNIAIIANFVNLRKTRVYLYIIYLIFMTLYPWQCGVQLFSMVYNTIHQAKEPIKNSNFTLVWDRTLYFSIYQKHLYQVLLHNLMRSIVLVYEPFQYFVQHFNDFHDIIRDIIGCASYTFPINKHLLAVFLPIT